MQENAAFVPERGPHIPKARDLRFLLSPASCLAPGLGIAFSAMPRGTSIV